MRVEGVVHDGTDSGLRAAPRADSKRRQLPSDAPAKPYDITAPSLVRSSVCGMGLFIDAAIL